MASDISDQLRLAVAIRARYRCEYCLIHQEDAAFVHQIDHVVSRKHGGLSVFGNLAYACILCNRHKGSDVASIDPNSGEAIRLFDPRRDTWSDHFRIESAMVEPLSDIGIATIRLLKLNTPERVAERAILRRLGSD